MLRVISRNFSGLRDPANASLALAFSSFGDAFLYPFLPQHAAVMSIPIIWVGVLLSINRFIRILFNPIVVKLFARYGVKQVMVFATVTAAISTIGYGLGWGLLSLLLFRVIWGMSFAILRIGSLAYALEHDFIGVSMGVSKGIQEAGPMIALFIGPMLLYYFSIPATFVWLAFISIPAIWFSLALPGLAYVPAAGTPLRMKLPSLFNSMTFITSFIIEGMLIIVIGTFLAMKQISLSAAAVTALAGGYLAYRRLSSLLFAPLGGLIADRIGLHRVFSFSLLMIIAGLLMLLAGWVTFSLIVIFTFNSINNTIAPAEASARSHDRIRAVAINATWRDSGAALGTVAGGLLLSGSYLSPIFTVATFILSALLLIYHRRTNN